jgi:hypothetical protein
MSSGPVTASVTASASVDAIGGRPVAMEVDLGRGLVLPNPVIVASGPFGYGVEVADAVDLQRLGGIVTRSTTLKPRSGNPAPRTVDVPAGVLLGMGLQNPGIEAVIERYAPTWARWSTPVIVSLGGEAASDLASAARQLEGLPGVAGIELNVRRVSGPARDGPPAHRQALRGGRGRARGRPGGRGGRRGRDRGHQHLAGARTGRGS